MARGWSRAPKRHPCLPRTRSGVVGPTEAVEVVVAVAAGEIDHLSSQENLLNHGRPAGASALARGKAQLELDAGDKRNVPVCP